MKRIGISGHRPNRLGGYNWDSQINTSIRSYFRDILTELLEQSDETYTVISGVALGFDQYIADVVIKLKKEYKGRIFLEAAIPFRDQYTVWSPADIDRYFKILENADYLYYVDTLPGYKLEGVPEGGYHIQKLHLRNKYVVDTMDIGLVLYNGHSKGGTFGFIEYSKKRVKELVVTLTSSI